VTRQLESSIRRAWESISPSTPLHASDNRSLFVLSPGVPNGDAGPDYIDALIRLDGRLYRGDVEVHTRERDWQLHHHHTDPHYNRVILHVVARSDRSDSIARTAGGRILPTLVINPGLPAEAAFITPSVHIKCTLACTAPAPAMWRRALTQLGWNRVERRIASLGDRLEELMREAGDEDDAWDQLLFEGICEGMGYTKNKSAFHELARNISLCVLRRWGAPESDAAMALLFGGSGLLPSSRGLRDRESRLYVRRLRRRWKVMRRAIHRPIMHEADWLFFRLRPVNFPTARLAVLGHILPRLTEKGATRRLLQCIRDPQLTPRERLDRLRQFFAFVPDAFWRRHLHFRGTGPGSAVALGTDRIDVIIFSTLLPLGLLYGRLHADRPLTLRARGMARTMAGPPPNSVTRKVEQRLPEGTIRLDTALLHHGAIELSRRFCEAGRCAECPVSRPTQRDGSNAEL